MKIDPHKNIKKYVFAWEGYQFSLIPPTSEKSPKSYQKGSPNEPQMKPKLQKHLPGPSEKHSQKTSPKKTPKRPPKKTCLSKGTGSAFKGWAIQKHVRKSCSNCSSQKEQSRTKKGEYKHHCSILRRSYQIQWSSPAPCGAASTTSQEMEKKTGKREGEHNHDYNS